MLSLVVAIAATAALFWIALRYRLLRRDLAGLAEALQARVPYLSEHPRPSPGDAAWLALVREANALTAEFRSLSEQRTDHLTQLETTLSSLQEAVLIVDSDNYIRLANKALHALFPTVGPAVGQRVEVIIQSLVFLQHLSALRAGQAVVQAELEIRGSGSGERDLWVEVTGALVPETGERGVPWTLFVLHDISRQKRLELVRKEFVANVSHELKTPLSVIKGYVETLVDEHAVMPVETRTKFLGTVLRHAERLTAILEDLLALSRLESSSVAVQVTHHELVAHVRAMIDDFTPRFAASGHVLSLSAEAEQIHAEVDLLKLNQVWFNLLENAQKHTPAGTTVELGLRLCPQGQKLESWVQDDGPGIPAKDLSRIFERFYRIDKGRSRETGGTGLGLSIVKHIVQLHGGSVRAESEFGKGTRITFALPLTQPKREGETVIVG